MTAISLPFSSQRHWQREKIPPDIIFMTLLTCSDRSYNAFLASSSGFLSHQFTIFGNQRKRRLGWQH